MFTKGSIAAAVMVAALALMPQAASAKTTIQFGVGINSGGNWCYGHPYSAGCGYGYRPYYRPYYPPPPVVYYGGYYDGGYRDYYDDGPSRLSCNGARNLLFDHGFHNLRSLDCDGRYYSFRGVRGSHLYVVRVNSRTGNIAIISRD
jgi:hypothetical protein